MNTFIKLTRALSDRNRIRVVLALDGGELCVCQIIDLLSLAPSTVSKHLSILENAGLVIHRKQGRWVYYRLAKPATRSTEARLLKETLRCAGDVEEATSDAERLEVIRQTDPEALCRKLLKRK